jgi:hypothetical protein
MPILPKLRAFVKDVRTFLSDPASAELRDILSTLTKEEISKRGDLAKEEASPGG